ncbi:MAG: hypothetical protein ACP5FU_06735 [Nitrososphaeria archaeon]
MLVLNAALSFSVPSNYQQIAYIVLAFADGVIIGLAIKKGIVSFILLIIGILLSSYIGLTLPGLSLSVILSKIVAYSSYLLSKAPAMFAGLPVLFLIGLAIGLWKG